MNSRIPPSPHLGSLALSKQRGPVALLSAHSSGQSSAIKRHLIGRMTPNHSFQGTCRIKPRQSPEVRR
jgi:hypothetical protein